MIAGFIRNQGFLLAALGITAAVMLGIYLDCIWIPLTLFGLLVTSIGFLYPSYLFYLVIASIPFSFEYSISETFGTDLPDELFMLVMVGAALLGMALHYHRRLEQLVKHPIFLLLILQYTWSVVSCVHSQHVLLSTKYVVSKIWYIIPFVVVPQWVLHQKKNWRTLAYVMVVPILIIAAMVILKHSTYGFSFASINDAAKPIFRNHVTYGASLSIGFSVLVGIVIMYPAYRKQTFIVLGILLLLAAIYFSFTRGTWLSVMVSFIMAFLLFKRWITPTLLVASAGMLLMVIYLVKDNRYFILMPDYEKTITHDNLSEHLDAMYSMKELSTSERFYRWVAAFRMSTEHPWVGFGPSTFYSEYKPFADARFKTYVSDNPEKSTVHNYFLLTLVEQGFVGLLLLVAMILLFFRRCEKLFYQVKSRFYKTIVLIMLLVMTNLVVVNFFSDMIETDKVGTFYFLCFGVLMLLENQYRSGELPSDLGLS